MAYFQTQNPYLGKFSRVLQWKMLAYFIAIWSIVRSFIWYRYLWLFGTFSRWDILNQEKFGNPARNQCWDFFKSTFRRKSWIENLRIRLKLQPLMHTKWTVLIFFIELSPRWVPGVTVYLTVDALYLGLLATALCLSFFPTGLTRCRFDEAHFTCKLRMWEIRCWSRSYDFWMYDCNASGLERFSKKKKIFLFSKRTRLFLAL
jgi:hypothetical protein